MCHGLLHEARKVFVLCGNMFAHSQSAGKDLAGFKSISH